MPFYHKLGKIPPKRHTQFRQENGSLYQEQLFGTIGFDGMSSNLYHVHAPTRVANIGEPISMKAEIAVDNNMTSRMLKGWEIAPKDDYLESRVPVLVNNDVQIKSGNDETNQDMQRELLSINQAMLYSALDDIDIVIPFDRV